MAFFFTEKAHTSTRSEVDPVVPILIGYLNASGEFIKVRWLDVHLPSEIEYVCVSGI
jgi:hypothetical protein